jgi:hypothetical protein
MKRVENLIAKKLSERKLPFLVAFKIIRVARKYSVKCIFQALTNPMNLYEVACIYNKINREEKWN